MSRLVPFPSTKLNVDISSEGIMAQFHGYSQLKEIDWEHYQKKHKNIHSHLPPRVNSKSSMKTIG